MLKKLNNWHLVTMAVIASVLSLTLLQQHVLAAWLAPTQLPAEADVEPLVFSPASEDLDLQGNKIIDSSSSFEIDPAGNITLPSGELCFGIDCDTWATFDATDTDWTDSGGNVYRTSGNIGIGTAVPTAKVHILDSGNTLQLTGIGIYNPDGKPLYIDSADSIYFNQKGSNFMVIDNTGDVGIGTETPNKRLHVHNTSGNAEIDIQSVGTAGDGNHWGIYHDSTSLDLRFWNKDDLITFTNEGYVGIGKTNPTRMLDVEGDTVTAIHGEVSNISLYGIHGENTVTSGAAIYGEGGVGVKGEATVAGGIGISGWRSSGDYAGYFRGTVRIIDGGGETGYLHLNTINGTPPSSDCNTNDHRGRMIWDYGNDRLFICDYESGGGGGWKIGDLVPQEA